MAATRAIDDLCINTIRTLSMDAVQKAGSGHPGAPMGMAPAMYVLWDRFLRHDPANPSFPNRDRFVLSMGHASMLLYSTLHLTGYGISLDDLKAFRQLGGICPGHPESTLTPGVETTTGPLGQGAGNSMGMAIAQRWLASYFNRPGHEIVDYLVYAFCSDGDFMEGVCAESASLAGHLGLDNLIWLYDRNRISIDGETSITFTENVAARFQAYGWFVQHVGDVLNLDELHTRIEAAQAESSRPSLIVVDTQIGYGSPNRAGTAKAHGEPLGEDEVRLAKESYGWDPDHKFVVPDEVVAHMREPAKRRGRGLVESWQARFDAYATSYPELAQQWRQMQGSSLPDDWAADLPVFDADEKGIATRVAAAQALHAIAPRIPWLLGGSADLAVSTKTTVPDSEYFQKDCPEGRNLAFGVREHAMGAVMNGLALSRIRPFGSSFLTFTDYCRPAIRLAAISRLPVIFVFTHDSIGLGEDGPTHQPVEQIASLRAMPDIDVIRPGDANEAVAAWKYVMPITDRPVLLVLTRQRVPTLDREKYAPAEGLFRGAYVLTDCDGTPDVLLIGTGSEVQLCVKAQERLSAEGVKARVISMPCCELFDRQDVGYRDSVLPPAVQARVSVEAGATWGWARYIGSEGSAVGLDRFGASAPSSDVMSALGFTVDTVLREAKRQIKRIGHVDPGGTGANPESDNQPVSDLQRTTM